MVKHDGRRHAHGMIALEFAMVFPMLLATFMLSLTFGLGLFAKYEAWNIATNAARKCIAQEIPINMATLPGCVGQEIGQAMVTEAGYNPCYNWSAGATIWEQLPTNNTMGLLTVTINCRQESFLGTVNFFGGGSSAGLKTEYNLQVVSALPFLNYQ